MTLWIFRKKDSQPEEGTINGFRWIKLPNGSRQYYCKICGWPLFSEPKDGELLEVACSRCQCISNNQRLDI